MTATASWWAGSKGQNLIKQLNGSASATALGNWLASTMPNLFGAGSPYATAGKTNTAIATMMVTLNKSTATALEANILALALNAYATSSTLAGNTKAAQAGFTVTPAGVGGYAYNVFGNGAVFGVANSLNVTVSQYLAAANAKSAKGVAWALDPSHRATAQSVLVTINAIGKIK